MIWKFFILQILSTLLFLVNCSTGPEFERNNPLDFEGNNFSPRAPLINNYQITINDNNNVPIIWVDRSDIGTGFRVYKSLGNDTTRILLAEFDKDVTSYTDTTKVFAFPTLYHVATFYESAESSSTQGIAWRYIVSAFEVTFQNDYENIRLDWGTVISPLALDGFLIKIRTDSSSTFKTIGIISTPNGESFFSDFTLPTPENGFIHEFKVFPFKIYKSDTTLFEDAPYRSISTGPKDLKLDFLSPDSLKATWIDFNDFEDSFQLTITYDAFTKNFTNETVTLDKNTTSHVFVKDFTSKSIVTVKLIGLHNGYASPELSTDIRSD